MKKLIFMVIALGLTMAGFSQTKNVQFGIKAGVNLADYNDNIYTTGSRTGFHAGLLAHVHLRPNWALQPEILYSTQGAEFSGGKHKIDYINIPILIQYMFRSGFRIETGIQPGFLTSAENEENDGDQTNIKSSFKSTDISLPIGIGYIAPTGFGFDARYNLGLTDITKGGADVKNRVWQFGVFYQFRR
jgi:hypothetical protein